MDACTAAIANFAKLLNPRFSSSWRLTPVVATAAVFSSNTLILYECREAHVCDKRPNSFLSTVRLQPAVAARPSVDCQQDSATSVLIAAFVRSAQQAIASFFFFSNLKRRRRRRRHEECDLSLPASVCSPPHDVLSPISPSPPSHSFTLALLAYNSSSHPLTDP